MKRILFALLLLFIGFFISPWIALLVMVPLFYAFPYYYEGIFVWCLVDFARTVNHTEGTFAFMGVAVLLVVSLHIIEFLRPSISLRV